MECTRCSGTVFSLYMRATMHYYCVFISYSDNKSYNDLLLLYCISSMLFQRFLLVDFAQPWRQIAYNKYMSIFTRWSVARHFAPAKVSIT